MERHGHDTVCGIESLLDSIAVMDVDIDVQHSLVVPDGANTRPTHLKT